MQEALRKAQFFTKMLPYYETTWCLLAQIQWQMNLLSDAEVSLKHSLALAPRNASTQFYLGFVYQLQGQLDKAAAQFKEAANLQPEIRVYQDALSAVKEALKQTVHTYTLNNNATDLFCTVSV